MTKNQIQKIQNILKNNEPEDQLIVAIEEMSELTKELTKVLRAKQKIKDMRTMEYALAEEIADVKIMLKQVELIFGEEEFVSDVLDQKLDTTLKRY